VTVRVLALLRIALALAILADLGRWAGDFTLFFTSSGPLTLSAMVADAEGGKEAFSLYNSCTYSEAPVLLFALTVLTVLALALGFRGDLAGPVAWLLMLSLQNRASIALDRWDALLLASLAFAPLSPWDRVWALRPAPRVWPQRAVAVMMALALLGSFVPSAWRPESAASFFALGPRSQPPDGVWYVALVRDRDGRQWQWSRADHEPSFARESSLFPNASYRQSLYLGGLSRPDNWGLRYWLAYYLFKKEELSQGPGGLALVEVHQCDARGHRLFARWPMQETSAR
jgi:hypothetical protein